MVTRQVLAQGMQVRHTKDNGAQTAYFLQSTITRWAALQVAMAGRRSNIRAAARRANRKVGLPLARLPFWVSHRKGKPVR